jgi:hypothetical protein
MPLSDQSQLAALDSAINAFRSGSLPSKATRDLLAEHLMEVRARVERAKAEREALRRIREKQIEREREELR